MAKIGPRTLRVVKTQLDQLLNDYANDIDEAYIRAEKSLLVGLSVSLTPDNKGVKIKTTITFTAHKITDEIKTVFDEDQISLFNDEENEPGPRLTGPPPDETASEDSLPEDDDDLFAKLINE